MHLTAWKGLAAFTFILSQAFPAHALIRLEGRIKGAPRSGAYDLLIQVRNNQSADGASRLLQTIQLAKVDVGKGRFRIALDMDLKSDNAPAPKLILR